MWFTEYSRPRLAGLARLAASGGVLAAKRRVEYLNLPAQRLVNRCRSRRVPFRWTINPYRGCEFGCRYCYARYTHEFLELRDPLDFETKIFVKQFHPARFREELGKIPPADWIAIGTATDPYQPAERRYGVTRKLLSVLSRVRGRRLSITTKSDLVVRDLDLLVSIGRRNMLHVAVSITTMDEPLARLLEPYAPAPRLRMAAVRTLRAAGVQAGVLLCPILPEINDSEPALDAVARAAARARAACLGGGLAFLKPGARQVFFAFLGQHFPSLAAPYRRWFAGNGFPRGSCSSRITERLERVRARRALPGRFPEYRPPGWRGEAQRELPFGGAGEDEHLSVTSTC